jgi:hypothetical protein
MKATYSSEISVDFQRRYIPEERTLATIHYIQIEKASKLYTE